MEDWLRELLGTPDKEYQRFEAALSLLPGLSPDEATGLLAERLRMLEAGIAQLAGQLAVVAVVAVALSPRTFRAYQREV